MNIDETTSRKLQAETLSIAAKNFAVGGFAGVVSDGDLVWQQPYGLADLEARRVPDENSAFLIGSVTKTFTATAIFQLRDAGKLDLEDRVTKHIPELAESADVHKRDTDITIRRLLTHTAGLNGDLPVGRPYFTDEDAPDREEVLSKLGNVKLGSEPGTRYKYSNLGFSLLGEIVRRVTGTPAEQYILEQICRPLGMDSTVFELTPEAKQNTYVGYRRLDAASNVQRTAHYDLKFENPSGGLYSTPRDLARWAGFHLSDEESPVLSLASRAEMRERQDIETDDGHGVCMNWMVDRVGGKEIFSHGGALRGFSTMFCIVPELGVGTLNLSNLRNFDGSIGKRLAEVLVTGKSSAEMPEKLPEVRVAQVPPDDIKDLPGIYLFDGVQIVWFEWWNGGLSAVEPSPTGGFRSRILPTGPDTYVVESGPLQGDELVVERDSSGTATGWVSGAIRLEKVRGL